jgi:hypothetical protein
MTGQRPRPGEGIDVAQVRNSVAAADGTAKTSWSDISTTKYSKPDTRPDYLARRASDAGQIWRPD